MGNFDERQWGISVSAINTAVQCPIRLWHGESDGFVPVHHAKYVASLLPKAHLDVLPNVGHLHTQALWRDVLNAAREVSSTA
ncbi:alpha/beta fold family hydrolase [Rhodothermus marinus DSM 4252] [Mycobacterium shimoidei]|uniref:Alpha/beta fold family hydrolase [Rhodothermus marinus DSM 4252] n=1 Tax=Mycobacterium shimoidei TaxID=29313 RepID=A0A375YZI5_MYCSH|nr:alpha/beta fold family hydrolase [Rhodothermus marinus DSM 4252] [Mycobacterium shimoidei]